MQLAGSRSNLLQWSLLHDILRGKFIMKCDSRFSAHVLNMRCGKLKENSVSVAFSRTNSIAYFGKVDKWRGELFFVLFLVACIVEC